MTPVIFPNPASDRSTIHQPVLTGKTILGITDLAGRLVLQTEINERLANVKISSLPEGIYLVQIFRQDEVFTYKMLKVSR
ncbi:MAG: T9SS type A sorting domain-containing protein [Bacteroidales bacterium]|nr:T9SS type A sorting domain-containing protein [Bacteroidales bacterium]